MLVDLDYDWILDRLYAGTNGGAVLRLSGTSIAQPESVLSVSRRSSNRPVGPFSDHCALRPSAEAGGWP